MEKHKKSTKILFTTLITFLCGMLVYTGGRYVCAQNRSDSDNLSITVVGKGSVEYTIDDIDYEVTEGATVYQTVPAEKEVKIQVKPEGNNTIDTISCNGDDVENVFGQNTWEETVKFDKNTVKDYKIIFKEVTESTGTQSQDTSEDVTTSENAVVAKEDEGTVENENSSLEATQESSEQASENPMEESNTKDIRLKDLNIDFNVTDISEETKLIIKAYQSGVYDDKTQIEARKKKAEETKLDKYCDDDYFLTDAYYKKYSEKMLMYDNCVILSRNSTKNVIKESEKEADKYAAKYDKAIQSNPKESSNKVQESFISRLFKTKSVSAANLSVIDHSYHQAWQGGGYISNGIWRLSNNCLSFCADGLGAEPSNGSSGPDNIVNSSNLRKALYYGYGGPGDCLTRRLGTSASIAWTDDLVSMAYTGHSVGSVAVGGYHWRIAGQSYWNEIMSKPDPIQYGYVAHVVSINGGGYNWQGVWKAKQPLAYGVYAPKGKFYVKKSSSDTNFTTGKEGYSLAGATYTLYSDSGCTKKVGAVTTDENGVSNTIEINTGTYYVRETSAPNGYNLDTNIKTVNINIGQTSFISTTDTPCGALRIIKKSDNELLTSKNSKYSLEDAQYGVYSDSECKNLIHKITTDANGTTEYLCGIAGVTKYYIKELSAPAGYKLNSKVYTATLNSKTTVDVNITETPKILSKPLLIHKTDANNHALENAQFEVKFYQGVVTNYSWMLSGKPTKTWYLKSDNNGDIYLDKNYLVSGKTSDSLYTDTNGNAYLTIGTISVKEIQAPSKDYKVDENTYLIQVDSSGSSDELTYSGKKDVIDKSSYPSKVRIIKHGVGDFYCYQSWLDNSLNIQSKLLLKGTQFLHTLPNGQTEVLTYTFDTSTDTGTGTVPVKDCSLEIKNLPVGMHTLKEIKVGTKIVNEHNISNEELNNKSFSNNFEVSNDEIEFEVKADGSIRDRTGSKSSIETYTSNDEELYVMTDYLKPYDLKIIKKDNYGNLIPDVTFSVYCGDDSPIKEDGLTIYHCSDYLGDYTTDSNGELLIQNIDRRKSQYFLVEKSMPNQYEGEYSFSDDHRIEYKGVTMKYTVNIVNYFNLYNGNPSGSIDIYAGDGAFSTGWIWDILSNDRPNSTNCFYEGNFFGDGTVTVPIVNILDLPRNWEVTKLDATNGKPISGVNFTLYATESKSGKCYKKEFVTDNEGKIYITGLLNGVYYLDEDETTMSSNYEAPAKLKTTWNGKTISYVKQLDIRPNYPILTHDGVATHNFVGEKNKDTGNMESRYSDITKDSLYSSKINRDYTDSYYTGDEKIANNFTLHSFVANQKKKSDLIIYKQDKSKRSIKNVEFTLFSDESCKNEVAKGTTDKEGKIRFKNVFQVKKSKEYYLKETKTPKNVVSPKSDDNPKEDAVWKINVSYITYDKDTDAPSYSNPRDHYTYTIETNNKYSNPLLDSESDFALNSYDDTYYLQNVVLTINNSYKTPKSLYIRKISAGSLDTYDDNLPSGVGNYLDGTTFTHTLPNGKTETLTYKSDSSTNDTEKKEGFMKITNLTQGRHTIQENTPANSLYSKNPNKLEFTVNSDGSIDFSKTDMNVLGGTDTNKIYAVSESADDTSNKLMVTFEDEFSPTKLRIHKTDIGGRALKGAVFTIYGDKDFSETIDTATSDVDGNVLFTKELKNDKEYWVKETQVPNGYQVAYNQYGAPMTYKIMIHTDKDGKKVFINNELVWNNDKNTDLGRDYKVSVTNGVSSSQMDMTVINTIPVKSQKSFKFTVHKTNNAGQSLAGAKFTLYMERGCYTPIATGTTNSNGEITFANIFNDKVSEFYMKEIEAPSGYKLPTNEDGSEKVWKIQATMDSNDKLNVYIDDEPVVVSESVTSIGNSKYAGKFSTSNGASYALQVNVKNYRLGLLSALPNTGSIMTVVLIVAGMCLVGLAIVKKKNR